MTTVPTVADLKLLALAVERYWAQFPADRMVKNGISEPGRALIDAVNAIPGDVHFITAELLGQMVPLDQVVSRALVEKAYEVLNAGPGSAGIARALGLLREAIG